LAELRRAKSIEDVKPLLRISAHIAHEVPPTWNEASEEQYRQAHAEVAAIVDRLGLWAKPMRWFRTLGQK
jgi:hypothetical protein